MQDALSNTLPYQSMKTHCQYYQAHILREKTWLLVAMLRSHEHIAFDRTIDRLQGILEFFVPIDMEPLFLSLMHRLEQEGVVLSLTRMPHRIIDLGESL